MQPLLEQGESGGRSIFVVTDWMAQQNERTRLPAGARPVGAAELSKNLVANLRDPYYDPGREYSVPWQSGMTGIMVDKDPRRRTSNRSATSSTRKYKGKVEMLNELRDTVPLVMKAKGSTRARRANDDWLEGDRQNQGRRANRARSAASPATTTAPT